MNTGKETNILEIAFREAATTTTKNNHMHKGREMNTGQRFQEGKQTTTNVQFYKPKSHELHNNISEAPPRKEKKRKRGKKNYTINSSHDFNLVNNF